MAKQSHRWEENRVKNLWFVRVTLEVLHFSGRRRKIKWVKRNKIMDYIKAKEYIDKVSLAGMVFGLESAKELLKLAGRPDKDLKIIHIAGTNGKGSVGTFLTEILNTAGYKIGRFFSPALFEYNETICISENGITKSISNDEIAQYITTISALCDKIVRNGLRHPSEFEIQTVMALMYFASNKCDIAIVECGLGGMDDATNIIEDNMMEIITSISYDHMKILGNSLSEIATNKCGIIKDDSIVVTTMQENEIMDVIKKKCQDTHSKIIIADVKDCNVISNTLYNVVYDDKRNNINGLSLVMPGIYQIENANIAVNSAIALNSMGYNISENDIKNGLLLSKWRGRFDVISSSPLIIADGAHNENAAIMLKNSIDEYLKDYKKIYVMSVFADKEYEKILSVMKDDSGVFYGAATSNKRALDENTLCENAREYYSEVNSCHTIEEALDKAIAKAQVRNSKDKTVIICFGSLSIMKQIYEYMDKRQPVGQDRVNNIINNNVFVRNMRIIGEYEKKRIFCGHGMEHLLDVARLTWIFNLENNEGYSKDVVYAAALLHDIGRARQYVDGTGHELAGVSIAKEVLIESGYNEDEIMLITGAISFHNNKEVGIDEINGLKGMLRRADNMSRQCYACKAQNQCKWPVDRKNLNLKY